jgi:hypothetical protein
LIWPCASFRASSMSSMLRLEQNFERVSYVHKMRRLWELNLQRWTTGRNFSAHRRITDLIESIPHCILQMRILGPMQKRTTCPIALFTANTFKDWICLESIAMDKTCACTKEEALI